MAQPWLAYLHIVPGAVYLLLAPLQLAYRICSRHYTFHRRLGRVLAGAAGCSRSAVCRRPQRRWCLACGSELLIFVRRAAHSHDLSIYNWAGEAKAEFKTALAPAAIIVLMAITFLCNGVAVFLRNRYDKRW